MEERKESNMAKEIPKNVFDSLSPEMQEGRLKRGYVVVDSEEFVKKNKAAPVEKEEPRQRNTNRLNIVIQKKIAVLEEKEASGDITDAERDELQKLRLKADPTGEEPEPTRFPQSENPNPVDPKKTLSRNILATVTDWLKEEER
jgi:hypothetical protein